MIDLLLNLLPEKSNFLNLFSYLTTRTILATLTGLMMVLFLGETFIKKIRLLQFQQSIGDRGPDSHKSKDGTPTMGGLLIIGSVILSGFLWGDLANKYLLLSIFCLFMFALIGFADDYNKIKHKNQEGISGKSKIFWQFICACIISVVLYTTAENKIETSYIVPFFKDVVLDFGIWFIFISIFIIIGSSNAVNLTDGLDGLAILPVIIITSALGIIAWASGNIIAAEYLYIPHIIGTGELLVLCGAMVGAGIGFLWFNTYPAQIFMGDVGSLSMGAFIALIAIIVRHEIVFAVMAMVFVMEAMSVILQVASFKIRKKRIFRMAPIHHHFELMGWKEPKIIVRFWILTFIFVLIGLSLLKIR
ncbi:MAG: phospho-N-acetylmuramoyl-pentapeptide-transferase [Amoebophilaceae bacterium TMED152]|mgnify:FL=1|nr:phospho-N-acetylmuramoyl-pentapeptide-transferase [Gammaproteobacteria bacterium]RPH02059.1 MAG: phospho-N-acetylmuramoyl-pentapeptide-transferase [Amoebophilaceae bacterium TMED152]|tara:strand:+ start:59 stop:1141 length:1083 start_codon:yes stop_codon:yes gene_type:complete